MDALVLSGGGARGAYEVGIIRYLREELPASVRRRIQFDLITGTSVGALNGCFLAATADDPDHQASRLSDIWAQVRLEEMYDFQWGTAFQAARDLYRSVRGVPEEERSRQGILGGMLNTAFIQQVVAKNTPWENIGRNIEAGHLHGVAVSTMEVVSGQTVTFVQREDGRDFPPSEDTRRRVVPVTLGPEHALASAAIPLIFPSVEIGERYYCDGGLRQNTPLSPALRMGATRVFVISLRHDRSRAEQAEATAAAKSVYPDPLMLAGKVMDALLLDHLDYDLSVLKRINRLLELGEETYGADFRWVIGQAVASTRGVGYKKVEAFHISPSQDLGKLAAQYMQTVPEERRKVLMSTALGRKVASKEASRETDLMSYLLFDSEFAHQLEELAMHDAHAQREQLIRYFEGGAGNL